MSKAKLRLYTGPALNVVDIDTYKATLLTYPGYTLYPQQRANIVNNYANMVKSGETLVILTQDEIIIRGVMLMVAMGKLDRDEVEITYVYWKDAESDEIVQKECKLAEDGRFEDEFPDGMFDVNYNLTAEIMKYSCDI